MTRVMRSEIAWAASVVLLALWLSAASGDWGWMDVAWGYVIVRGCILAARWLR